VVGKLVWTSESRCSVVFGTSDHRTRERFLVFVLGYAMPV
jgi:hypothetical protein